MSFPFEVLEKSLLAESGRQKRMLDLLEEQKLAVVARDQERIEKVLAAISAATMEGAEIENERQAAVATLASSFGLDPSRLTLREMVRLAGPMRPSLEKIHAELRRTTDEVFRLNQNIGLLVRQYGEVYTAALGMFLRAAGLDRPSDFSGSLGAGVMVNREG